MTEAQDKAITRACQHECLMRELVEALEGMCDIWRSTCSIYGWDVQHLSQFETALKALARAKEQQQ